MHGCTQSQSPSNTPRKFSSKGLCYGWFILLESSLFRGDILQLEPALLSFKSRRHDDLPNRQSKRARPGPLLGARQQGLCVCVRVSRLISSKTSQPPSRITNTHFPPTPPKRSSSTHQQSVLQDIMAGKEMISLQQMAIVDAHRPYRKRTPKFAAQVCISNLKRKARCANRSLFNYESAQKAALRAFKGALCTSKSGGQSWDDAPEIDVVAYELFCKMPATGKGSFAVTELWLTLVAQALSMSTRGAVDGRCAI